jgi:hypothetical protein
MNRDFARHQKLPGFDMQSCSALSIPGKTDLDEAVGGRAVPFPCAEREAQGEEKPCGPQFEGTQQSNSSRP